MSSQSVSQFADRTVRNEERIKDGRQDRRQVSHGLHERLTRRRRGDLLVRNGACIDVNLLCGEVQSSSSAACSSSHSLCSKPRILVSTFSHAASASATTSPALSTFLT